MGNRYPTKYDESKHNGWPLPMNLSSASLQLVDQLNGWKINERKAINYTDVVDLLDQLRVWLSCSVMFWKFAM